MLDRRLARLRIPWAALEERKKRGSGVVSKISDNEESTASLWDSEVTTVKDTVGERIAAFGQRRENDGEISSGVGREEAGYIFKDEVGGLKSVKGCGEVKEE